MAYLPDYGIIYPKECRENRSDMDTILLDHQLQETFFFEDPSFPIKYYVDNLNQWADGQVPLHWHLGYECFSAACQEIGGTGRA